MKRNKLLEIDGVAESLDPAVLQTVQCSVFDAPEELFGKSFPISRLALLHYFGINVFDPNLHDFESNDPNLPIILFE